MPKKKILFIIGSPNQTSQHYQISTYLNGEYDCWFSQLYPDYFFEHWPLRLGLLENTIMSGHFKAAADKFLEEHNLQNDYMGKKNTYDMVVHCTDMLVTRKNRKVKTVWVQEGMVDRMTTLSRIVKWLGLPGYYAMNTSLNGSSNLCDIYCVASQGYKNFFAGMGTDARKIVVTGIPNFDNVAQYIVNDFPYKNYVLVCTSDIRECFGKEDRMGYLLDCKKQIGERDVIFKLHPNELYERAVREIKQVFGEHTKIFQRGDSNAMIANCDELFTQWSTLVYVGIGLGKIVHSYFDVAELERLMPLQNGGTSAKRIATLCDAYMRYNGSGIQFLETFSNI